MVSWSRSGAWRTTHHRVSSGGEDCQLVYPIDYRLSTTKKPIDSSSPCSGLGKGAADTLHSKQSRSFGTESCTSSWNVINKSPESRRVPPPRSRGLPEERSGCGAPNPRKSGACEEGPSPYSLRPASSSPFSPHENPPPKQSAHCKVF